MTADSPSRLKFVVLGPPGIEVECFARCCALAYGGQEVAVSEVGGCSVYRSQLPVPTSEGGPAHIIELYAAAASADFRAVFSLLFRDCAGVVGLIPADPQRREDGRQVLGLLQSQFLRQIEGENSPPFLLQYQWREENYSVAPEVIDELLGVDGKVVERVFTRFNEPDLVNGLEALLARVQGK